MVINMVDRNQLGLLNSLNQRAAQIQSWLAVVKREPKITAMTLTVTQPAETEDDSETVVSVTIPTADIATPPQMMTAIETQLQTNYEALVQQMTGLGVTASAMPSPPEPRRPPQTPPQPPREPPKPEPKQPPKQVARPAPKPAAKPTSHRR